MKDDLQDAKACILWAETQMPVLTQRIDAWKSNSHKIWFDDNHPQPGKVYVKFCDVNHPDPIINAEIGVIINSIRSSLDILATTLFHRHNMARLGIREKDVYFPAPDISEFASGNWNKGKNFIEALPATERGLIEPFYTEKARNNILLAIHDLDVKRKHRRLIAVHRAPTGVTISPLLYFHGIQFVPVWPALENDAIIATASKSAKDTYFHIPLDIFFDEAIFIPPEPVLTTLTNFLGFTKSIIELFN